MTNSILPDQICRNGREENYSDLQVADDGARSGLRTPMNGEALLGLNYSSFYGMDSLSEAWFGQQLGNLDWLDLI